MEPTTQFPLYALLVCNAFLGAAIAISLLRMQRLQRDVRAFWQSPAGIDRTSLTKDLSATQPDDRFEDSARIERHLAGIEKRIELLAETVVEVGSNVEPTPGTPQFLPFDNAVRLAKKGAGIHSLMENCGLSRTEARLLARVHAPADGQSIAN